MKFKQYHILNGDALKEQFPEEIDGDIIITRECLVDGDVSSNSLEELFEVRATFLNTHYGDVSLQDYYAKSVFEFDRIKAIPQQAVVNLWFEDDLFCQVNFWFVAYLLTHFTVAFQAYLVRPKKHTPYGFGGLNEDELKSAFSQRIALDELDKIASLWDSYKDGNLQQLKHTASSLKQDYPFILDAIEAHIERIPTDTSPGRPTEALIEIIDELGTSDFAPVFREFNKRECIYGYGDLQVKRIFDKITK